MLDKFLSMMELKESDLKEWLRPVEDPDLGMPLLELGLIYEAKPVEKVDGKHNVHVKMTLTSPGCPAAGYLVEQIRKRMEEHPQVKECKVELVWDPKWDPKTMASDEAKEELGIW